MKILFLSIIFALMTIGSLPRGAVSQSAAPKFAWPEGKAMALSLSFDDARVSQVDVGAAVLDRHGAKATFYVMPPAVEKRLDGWKKMAAAGHEIGSHSVIHPCSGNFPFSRTRALEDYTVQKMRAELKEARQSLRRQLGVEAESFAYPCGQKFVGRGRATRSYVPVVAELHLTGRGWLDEAPNDPGYVDFAQLTGMEMDGREFDQILPLIEKARESGQWLVLAGHEINRGGNQTTRVSMLEKLLPYASDPANRIWLAPVGTVAKYVRQQRGDKQDK